MRNNGSPQETHSTADSAESSTVVQILVSIALIGAAAAATLVTILSGINEAEAQSILQNGSFNNSTVNWTRSDTNRIRWNSDGFANGGSIQADTTRGKNITFTGTATQTFSISGTQISQGIIDFQWKKCAEDASPQQQDMSVRLLSPTSSVVWSWSDSSIGPVKGDIKDCNPVSWTKVTSPNLATTLRSYGAGTYTFELGWTLKTNAGTDSIALGRFDEVVMILAFGPPHANYAQPAYWCARCHANHSGVMPRMLRQPTEEGVCYQCHDGTGSTFVIQRYFSQAFHMPIENTTGDHQTRSNDPIKTKRHVECIDCHNPHVDRPPNHYDSGFPTNAASTKLAGVWGVSVAYSGAAWVTASTYTVIPTVAYEYQLCFKCHSYYAYGGNPPVSPSFSAGYNVVPEFPTSGYVPYSPRLQTDQSLEFNPNNESYHPVVTAGKNPFNANGNNYSAGLRNTPYGQLTPTSRIQCNDCHRAGATDSYSPKPAGPHGSPNPFILMGQWDPFVNRNHSSYYDNATQYPNHPILCFNCHDPLAFNDTSSLNTGFKTAATGTNLHSFHLTAKNDGVFKADADAVGFNTGSPPGSNLLPAKCLNCHSGVIHASPNKRLIVNYQDPKPYRTYWTRMDRLDSWYPNPPTNQWSQGNCNLDMNGGNGHGKCKG